MDTDQRRRNELAAFLRDRRARVDRSAVNMPPAPRNRAPGLRREEVAALAGVSVTWYTWLEQARPINPSRSVLGAIARLFALTTSETDYLLRLGGHSGAQSADSGASAVSEQVRHLLESLPGPAFLLAANWAILAWNAAYARLYARIEELEPDERNLLWLVFTDPTLRELMPDWDAQSRRFVSEFRAAVGPAIGTADLSGLVARLCAASAEFAQVWASHDVETFSSRERVFAHPTDGRIAYEEHKLVPLDAPGHQLVLYLA